MTRVLHQRALRSLTDSGYIAGCKEMPAFLRVFGELGPDGDYFLSSATNSLLTSILSVGTFFGAIFASTIGDAIGRRLGIVTYIGEHRTPRHFSPQFCSASESGSKRVARLLEGSLPVGSSQASALAAPQSSSRSIRPNVHPRLSEVPSSPLTSCSSP